MSHSSDPDVNRLLPRASKLVIVNEHCKKGKQVGSEQCVEQAGGKFSISRLVTLSICPYTVGFTLVDVLSGPIFLFLVSCENCFKSLQGVSANLRCCHARK